MARRLFLGSFTAGAVTVALGESTPAAAETTTTTFPGPVVAQRFSTDSTIESAYFKTTSVTDNAVTVYQAAASGRGVALNVVSDNPENSAMYLEGTETGRGTLKITHQGYDDGSDRSAAALSIDLRTAGTAAQGIYLTATNGPTTGSLIALRNNPGRDDFIVTGAGRIGIGVNRGDTPRGQVHIVQQPGVPAGVLIEGVVRIANTATVPTSADSSGGGNLYAVNGALMWRSANGKVTQIASA
ncbi:MULTISPECIES: hyaluronoglucosaminidase [unclassified Actinoplanes]|uniref:hyaluronoglucosaminidase n=1 Tax=unclassified Actinoplanes TaxID=2626549 RepID=UPI00043A37EC|nr:MULTISPECIES: hyaluronoglucosaminidase [unclassified Actinoplanes]